MRPDCLRLRFALACVGDKPRRPWIDCAILVSWLVLVSLLVARHVMWRDEVRALTLALGGDDLHFLFNSLRGDGHPALRYLMLRAAYSIFHSVAVLPGLAFAVGLGTVALLIFRSPFPRVMTADLRDDDQAAVGSGVI